MKDGTEVFFDVFARSRLSERLRETTVDSAVATEARRTADGIFRVWSTVYGDPVSFPWQVAGGEMPLTASAQQAIDDYNLVNDPFTGCRPKTMPTIMGVPTPMAFFERGKDILLIIEEYDTERLIHMGGSASDAGNEFTIYDYSTGRWEGDELVLETTNIEAGLFDNTIGLPQSRQITTVERFNMNDNQDRLDYELTLTDSENFTQPAVFSRYFGWKPEVALTPYNCSSEADR